MSLLRKDIDCQVCDYRGQSVFGLLGMLLWVLAFVLFLLSWVIWPLFLLWPFLALLLLLVPIGHKCPQCGTWQIKKRSS